MRLQELCIFVFAFDSTVICGLTAVYRPRGRTSSREVFAKAVPSSFDSCQTEDYRVSSRRFPILDSCYYSIISQLEAEFQNLNYKKYLQRFADKMQMFIFQSY